MPEPLKTRSGNTADLPEGYRMTELGPLPKEWQIVPFKQTVLRQRTRVGKIKQQLYKAKGRFPIVDQGKSTIAGYWDNIQDVYQGPLPVVIFGDHTRVFKYIDFPFVVGGDGVKVLIPNTKKFDPLFLFFAYINLRIPNRGYNRHFKILNEQQIPFPPLAEQRAIAHVLRTVQESKEATEKVINALREFKKSLRQHLFTYGPVSICQRAHIKLFTSGAKRAPSRWLLTRLEAVAKVKGGTSFPRKYQGKRNAKFPFFKVSDMNLNINRKYMRAANNWIDEYTLEKLKASLFPPQTIIFPKVGAALRTNKKRLLSMHSAIDNNLMAVTVRDKNLCLPEYLFYWFEKIDLNKFANDGPLPSITAQAVKKAVLPLPPIPEQRQIAEILQAVDRKIEAEENRKTALEELFKSLLHELMTAKRRLPKEFIAQFADKPGEKSENEA